MLRVEDDRDVKLSFNTNKVVDRKKREQNVLLQPHEVVVVS